MKVQQIKSNINFKEFSMPTSDRNYCVADELKVRFCVSQQQKFLPYFDSILKSSNDEKQITEVLYILDKMLDANVKNIDKLYPTLSRFNSTKSPCIQTFLAGIYRKIQVPDAFGPLVNMLIKNSLSNCKTNKQNFDPNEEIGGAILEYIKNYSGNTKNNSINLLV